MNTLEEWRTFNVPLQCPIKATADEEFVFIKVSLSRALPPPVMVVLFSPTSTSNASASTEGKNKLLIRYLTLHNFKSYAGIHRIGPLDEQFTAVVGPNGSGKSNVIDALLFVFGYKAKKMRQAKLADLIHSSAGSSFQFASVAVEFQDLDSTHFTIARKVSLDSKSEYFYNDLPSSYSQITLLLREKGVDLDHKRFLILQGEVEAISLMKPKGASEHEEGFLEYLEDIIGTNQLIPSIIQATQQYEELASEEAALLTRSKVSQGEFVQAERQKEAVVQAVEEENAFRQNSAVQLQIDRHSMQVQAEKVQQKITVFQEQMHQQQAKLEEEIGTSMEVEPSSLQETLTKSEKAHSDLKKQIDVKRKALCSVQEEEKAHKLTLKRLTKAREEECAKVTQRTATIDSLSAQIQAKSTQLESANANYHSAKQVLDLLSVEVAERTGGIQAQIDAHTAQLMPLKAKIAQIQKELAQLTHEATVFAEERESNLQKLAHTEEAIEQVTTTIAEKEQESAAFQSSVDKLTVKLEDSQVKAAAITERIGQKKLLLDSLHDAQSGSSSESRSRLGKLFEGIPGVHGRLGELGAVDERFVVAVNAAAGAAMENFVVQDTETAQKCVRKLKEHSAGRCTFIILDKIKRGGREQSPDSFPCARLVDLVELGGREEYFDAFWHALKDTLVCEQGMAEANSIAFGKKKRYRVVTLDGKLIDLSGTISGGGAPSHRNHSDSNERGISVVGRQMKRQNSASIDPQQLANEINALEEEITQLTKELDALNASIEEFSTLLAEVEATIKKNQTEVLWLSKTRTCNEAHLATWKEKALEHDRLQSKFAASEAEIAQRNANLAALQAESSKFTLSIAQLKEALLEAGGIQYRTAVSKCETLETEQEMLSSFLCKSKAELELAQKAQDKHAESDATAQRKLDHTKKALDSVQQEVSKLEALLTTLTDQQKEAQTLISDTKAELSRQKQQHQRVEIMKQNLQNFQSTSKRDLQSLKAEAKALTDSIDRINRELQAITLIQLEGQEPLAVTLYEEEEIEQFTPSFRKKIINALSTERKFIQSFNANTVATTFSKYQKAMEAASTDKAAWEALHSKREALKEQALALRKQRHETFLQGFWTISLHLKALYQTITQGGNAELELVDSLDPFAEGVVFSVMPPKKSWKNIAHLSGGEKTLASLALVLALHAYKPTPFYVMDEIDAALDWRNVSIIAAYLKERASLDAQFVVISLRSGMFEVARQMVGVYKQRNCSQVVVCA